MRKFVRHSNSLSSLPPHHPDYVPSDPDQEENYPSDDDLNLDYEAYSAKILANAAEEDMHLFEEAWQNWRKGWRKAQLNKKWDFTHNEITDRFYYHEGDLYYRYDASHTAKAGTLAGTPFGKAATRRVFYKGHQYSLAALVWFYHTKEPGVSLFTYKDGNTHNCSFDNLKPRG